MRWDVIYCHHYLNRILFRRFPHALATKGLLALCHPTVLNLERHARPSLRHLYTTNETRRLAETAGLLVIHYEESWGANDKHEARMLARVRWAKVPEHVELTVY